MTAMTLNIENLGFHNIELSPSITPICFNNHCYKKDIKVTKIGTYGPELIWHLG